MPTKRKDEGEDKPKLMGHAFLIFLFLFFSFFHDKFFDRLNIFVEFSVDLDFIMCLWASSPKTRVHPNG